jgi:hypothetical protein
VRLAAPLVAALLVVPVLAQGPANQQPPVTRLRGRVTAADGGAPVRNALVVISAVAGLGRVGSGGLGGVGASTSTDDQGRWEWRTVSGRYTIRVSKAGFVSQMYGQRRPFEPGKAVDLAEGQSLDTFDMALMKGGAIAGRVSDEFGEPIHGLIVTAMRYRYVDGVRQLQTVPGASLLSSLEQGGLVDDQGQFRIHGLPPGNYYVGTDASGYGIGPPGSRAAYVRTFYPGTAFPTGTVAVTAGREASGVDFRLVRSQVANVHGRVIDSVGNPVTMGSILLLPPDVRSGALVEYQASVRSDGSFTVADVPSGDYRLNVEQHTGRGVGPQNPELGSLHLSVNGRDIAGLVVQTGPSATASGRVLFEDGATPQGVAQIQAHPLAPAVIRNARPGGAVQANGTFNVSGLVGTWLLRAWIPVVPGRSQELFLKRVTLNGRDITDIGHDFLPGERVSGIEVILTRQVARFQGVVRDEKGVVVDDAAVIAFAADSSRWGVSSRYVGRATVDGEGMFQLPGLPEGDYYIIAAHLEQWRPRAVRTTLGATELKTLNLTIVR